MFVNTPSKFPEGAVLKLRRRCTRSHYLIEARAGARYCLRRVDSGVKLIEIAPETVRAIEKEISNVA